MPQVLRSDLTVPVAAGVLVENIIAGSEFEFAPGPQLVRMGIVADLADLGEITIQFGDTVLVSNAPVPTVTAGFPVLISEHMYYEDVARTGDRIKVSLRETGGLAALVYRFLMITQPLGA